MSHINDTCAGADLAALQRNHYFYGMLLDEHSLLREQRYVNHKRWMLNRLSLGKGVLCGLTVTWAEDLVCISAGVAIDGHGREVVVPQPIWVDPWQTTDDRGRPAELLAKEGTHEVYVCLAYLECPTDYTPVLVTDCETPNREAPSTIVEKYAVIVKPLAPGVPPPLSTVLDGELCKALSAGGTGATRKAVGEVLAARACAGDESKSCVVIASKVTLTGAKVTSVDVGSARPVVYSNPELFEMLLCRSEGGGVGPPGPPGPGIDSVKVTKLECDEEPWANLDDSSESPKRILELGVPRGCDGKPGDGLDDTLTKIVKINWPHDGLLTWTKFLKEGLQIDFSDEISSKPTIGPGWLLVSLELSGGAPRSQTNLLTQMLATVLRLLVWPVGTRLVYRAEGDIDLKSDAGAAPRHYAHFVPLRQLAFVVTALERAFVGDLSVLCRVVVKCDFLVDKNRKPVDGDHLRGLRPTANRVAGGEFESWFRLTGLGEVAVPGIPTPSAMRRMSSAARAKAELNILEQVFPGIGELATNFLIKPGG